MQNKNVNAANDSIPLHYGEILGRNNPYKTLFLIRHRSCRRGRVGGWWLANPLGNSIIKVCFPPPTHHHYCYYNNINGTARSEETCRRG